MVITSCTASRCALAGAAPAGVSVGVLARLCDAAAHHQFDVEGAQQVFTDH
jgi:hypothetical protein